MRVRFRGLGAVPIFGWVLIIALSVVPWLSHAASTPLPPGVLGWWAGEGNTADVLKLNGGTNLNATFASGKVGQAFVFNGTNASVQIGDSSLLSPHVGANGELTVEAWVYVPRNPAYDTATGSPYRAIVVKGSPGQWEYGLYISTNLEPVFTVWQPSGYTYSVTVGQAISLNQWHHLAGTLRKGQFSRLYVDGQQVAENKSFSGDTGDGTSSLFIGRRGDGQFFDGSVDEVTLYGRALSGSEVLAIYNAGASGKASAVSGAAIPYFTDFESGAGPEWTLSTTDSSESLMFSRFAGRFGNSTQTLTLTNLVPGQSYTLGFDFYAIDSWDGGSDYFDVNINGVPGFHYTFSNYNGDPPNVAQTYPGQPDAGRSQYGFNSSYVDAIYRNVEVTFTASSATTFISFDGANLSDVGDESWGIDNVGVRLSADLAGTYIRSTTLPVSGSTNSTPIESFSISANRPLLTSVASDASHYSLVEAGADNAFNTGDDVVLPLTVTLPGAGGRSVLFSRPNAPLQAGNYRFQASGLKGTNGETVAAFTQQFRIANPIGGAIESTNNGTLATAVQLPLSESPASSGFFSAYAVGTFSATGDVDYWRFDAEAGDVVTIRLEAESLGVYPRLRLRNASDNDQTYSDGDYNGVALIQNFTIATPGTYYIRVWTDNYRSRYSLRLDTSRQPNGPQLEREENGTQATATSLALKISPGLYQARVAGSLPSSDSTGDFYLLGTLNPGNLISVNALYPNGSTLTANQTLLSVQMAGDTTPLATSASGALNYTIASDGVYYVRVETTQPGNRAQYLLNITLGDGVPPLITGTSLPASSVTSTSIVQQITLNFSEDLAPSSVSNSANYELRCAGTDGLYGTGDDALYSVVIGPNGYQSGSSATFAITDGPLQPGRYRLTVSTNLQDRAGNKMAAPYVAQFTIGNLPGMVLENRNNDVLGTATLLTFGSPSNADGTVSFAQTVDTPSSPRFIGTGRFTGTTNLDLVTVNFGSGNVTFFANDGKGRFQSITNVATGGNPVSVAVGDFDGNGLADVAVANSKAGSVTIILSKPNAVFQTVTNITGFSQPSNLALADVNGDGKADLVVPNSGSVAVLLGRGNGNFDVQSTYNTGGSLSGAAIGDLNKDGKPDIVVSDVTNAKLYVLTNSGAGSFGIFTNIVVGGQPRYLAIEDLNGDKVPDLIVHQIADNTLSLLFGNGDATFQPRRIFAAGAADAYQFALADMNGDGRKDIIISGLGNGQCFTFFNDGTGNFSDYVNFPASYPIALAVGDFNSDGRNDIVISSYYNNNFTVWMGNAAAPISEDPPGSGLRTILARGARSNPDDVDYYRFYGNAGDQATLSVDTPGNPNASSLNYQLINADGSVLTSFSSDYHGWGQSGIVTLPKTGTYGVRVARNYEYLGEYQVRVTLARPPLQIESENNDTLSQADVLPFARTGNHLRASVAGYFSTDDGDDYYSLGALLGGSVVSFDVRQPAASGLAEVLSIYNSAGTLVTNSAAGVASFKFNVPAGQDDVYYVAVSAAPAGLFASSDAVAGLYGDRDYISLGNWFTNQTFTLSMWVNPSSGQPTYANIIDNNHTGSVNWTIEQQGGNINQYAWGAADGGTAIPFTLTPGVWQHIAVTRDSTNITRLYLNGVQVGSSTAPGQINYSGNQTLRIGDWVQGGRNWIGMMNDFQVWGRALSASEIAARMSATLSGNEPDLLGYWSFNEGFGTTAADLSPAHRTASLNGVSWVLTGPTNAVQSGLSAQYVLSIDLSNSVPPQITGVSLPADRSTTSNIITSFSVNFSEDMDPAFKALARNVYRYNGRSYVLTDSALNWYDAESAAVAMGGHLTSMSSAAQNAWLLQTFGGSELWIGLDQSKGREKMGWLGGDPYVYQNWSGGDPNNASGFERAVKMNTSGSWVDISPNYSLTGIVELSSSTDTDNDGLVDVYDPYPSDPLNAFDLRAAGPDGAFGTSDDVVYRIYSSSYTSGASASFAILDGPLQPGTYRFMATTALKDRFGVAMAAPYIRYFTNVAVTGFIGENRRGDQGSTTSLSLNPSAQTDSSFSRKSTPAVQSNPYFITQGDFNKDGYLDLAVANYSSGTVSILTNDHTGQFQTATNIPTGSGTISIAPADFNADAKLDLAVANHNAGTVSVLQGDGLGGFVISTNLTGLSNVRNLVATDLNHDGIPDLAIPTEGNGRVVVYFGTASGTLTNSASYTVGSSPETVGSGDLNGDGNPDLVVANYSSASMSVLLDSADGTFTVSTNVPTMSYPRFVTLGDVNGDGRLDAVVVNNGNMMAVMMGNGDGTFAPRVDYSIGSGDTYQVILADINGDGKLDAVVPGHSASQLITLLNNGDGTFGSQVNYSVSGSYPISVTAGDFNHDGRMDLATANYYWNNVSILLGNPYQGIAFDPAGTGLRVVAARGNLADSSDYGYWTFSAALGDRLSLAVENPGDPSSSQLLYRIYSPDGSQWTYFYSDGYGRGQLNRIVPASGTYTIRVEQSSSYTGEYRMRISLATAPVQLEAENNGSISEATPNTYSLTNGLRKAIFLGYIGNADNGADFYQLGNLAAGTQVTLSWARPSSSALSPIMEIYNASGTLVATSHPDETNLVYTVSLGNGGAYYAHVTSTLPFRAASMTNALAFNGSSSYVNLGAWAPGPQWSVQAWAMPSSIPSGRRTIAGAAGGGTDWGIVILDGRFAVNTRRNGGNISYSASTPAVANTYYHLAATCDGTNASLYINGVLAASGPVETNYSPYAGGTWIGGEVCCGNYFPGVIQDVSIWSRALSAQEVSGFMASKVQGNEAGLAGLWRLQDGTGSTAPDLSTNGHAGTLANVSWTALAPAGSIPSGILQQYLLSVSLLNTIPPQVLSDTLPAEETSSGAIVDRFNLTFSEDMDPSSVTNSANYELRGAGRDNAFGTADDQLYRVVSSPAYTAGTSASYIIPDGPLQQGLFRFTVSTNVTDPVGTVLPAPYVRTFAITNIPGYVLEGRLDNSASNATSLAFSRTNRQNGSFTTGATVTMLGTAVERLAAGRINGDANMDIVAALWDKGQVSVLLGNGDGTFQVKTNYSTGANAFSVALGNFNGDSNLDMAVANYGANNVTVLLGNGDGTFQTGGNFAVGTRPYHIVAADVNRDGKADLVVPNWDSRNVSILLGNGDGTFKTAVNYSVENNPSYASVADVNSDGKPDVLVANYNDNTVSLLLGNGDGTFTTATGIATGNQPRALTATDLNGDGKIDLAVFNGGDNTISVMFGNGNGTFLPRVNYAAGTYDGYELVATDLNGDGWLDLAAGGYNYSTVNTLLNDGDGTFTSASSYASGDHTVGLVAGDFNNDGRSDLAIGGDSSGRISVLLGNDTQALEYDAATGLRITAGRGNLADSQQNDYWSFDASAGDILSLATDVPGNPSASSLYFVVLRPDGSQFLTCSPDYYGRGQVTGTCPVSGTYLVRVSPSYSYFGEYRFRLTLAKSPMQVESENNDSLGNADSLNYTLASGHRQASVLGTIMPGDGGDSYRLGTLSEGAVINLSMVQPASSGLLGVMAIYDSNQNLVGYSRARASTFSYTVPPGAAGNYFASVWDAGPYSAKLGGANGGSIRLWGSEWISFTNAVIPSSGDFTVECWAYSPSPSGYRELVTQGSGGNAFYLGTDGSKIRAGDGWQNTGISYPFSGWHHFAIVKSSTNTLLYVDGQVAATRGSAIPNPDSGTSLRIGRQYASYGEYWPGGIDEVRIWNVARSAAEIQSNMNNATIGTEAGLVGCWSFDETTGVTVSDKVQPGSTGTIQGAGVWVPKVANAQPSGILSQYVLSLDLKDTAAPGITSVTLPVSSATDSNIIDRFTLNFSKEVSPAINGLNRALWLRNGRAYTLTSSSGSWYASEMQARSLGGHLVTINDAEENSWITNNFDGNFWIGLTDEATKGLFVWASGESFTFTNWDSGQPSTSYNQDYAYIRSNGKWATYQNSSSLKGLIEVSGVDSDGDGIPDSLDTYPNDPYNAFDLRAAGTDGLFDTADDEIYHLSHSTYTSGQSLDFSVTDGPLQPGSYRFLVTSSFSDLFGNGMDVPYARYFAVTNVPGYTLETRGNDSAAAASPLVWSEDPAGVKSVAARGNLSTSSDVDYYSFSGTAGDLFNLAVYVPGSPGGSSLRYQVIRPGGSTISDFTPSYNGDGEIAPIVLPVTGTYFVAVSQYYGYQGEYRFRITEVTPPLQMESEGNDTIANGDVVTFVAGTNSQSASVVGRVRTTSDLDYFNLGTITNGATVILNVRLPGTSTLYPIVSVYKSDGLYQPEATGGRSSDGLANVPITATGTYYALVRSSASGGMNDQYVLDITTVPTGSLDFPNLIVSAVNPPSGSEILSGQNITYSFSVANVGTLGVVAANWIDRAVISADSILGNGDDIPLGFFQHVGGLNPSSTYSVTNQFKLPEGITGDYYVIVQTDAGNAVNEFLFKGDNITVSTNTFHVNVAPYPDLTVENLSVTGPDSSSAYKISWNIANRGTGAVLSDFNERVVVRNQTTGALIGNTEQVVTSRLATNQAVAHTLSVTATNPGNYLVQVLADSGNNIFEFNSGGHNAAEANNSATNGFQIVAYFNVTLQSSPPDAGVVSGAGKYPSGTAVNMTATAVTNKMPYLFVNWTEQGVFQSADTNYTFIAMRDRTLTANFTLPTYSISASNNPSGAGVVSGQGTYPYGTTNILTANPTFGFRFTNWSQNGVVIAQTVSLTNIVTNNLVVTANYVEANTQHVVSTATSPTNVATVTGAGTYTNGQTATISAPASVTNPPSIYTFRQFMLNGSVAGTSPSLTKTFSTLDPTNMQYTAVYDAVSILPLVSGVTLNYPDRVPATTNFLLGLHFNRTMNTNFTPVVRITNANSAVQAVVPAGGVWSSSTLSNDTFNVPAITFSTGMDGTNAVWVSQARDLNGGQLTLTNVANLVVDVTPPTNPTLRLSASNNISATIDWASYTAPSDLSGFRVFVSTNSFTSVSGLTAVSSLSASARSFTYGGLSLDSPYYAAVVAIDTAGNSLSTIAPLSFSLPSAVPPPVTIKVTPVGSSSALVSWTSYDPSSLLGFAGFNLYYETSSFSSAVGHTVRRVLDASARTVQIDNLDRTRTYYFAVAGFNVKNAQNNTVTTATWTDPYAGQINANMTIGGAGQTNIDILQSISIVNNAVLTIPAGTTLRFAPGTTLTVEQGTLNAAGTALDPIVFTSSKDQPGFTAAAGDWNGVVLANGAGASVVRNVFVKYGSGLVISNSSPTIDALTAQFNTSAGLTVSGTATVNTTNALLAGNDIGAQQLGTAQLKIFNSVIKNNGTNALARGGLNLVANQVWWGSANAVDIDSTLQGAVDRSGPLSGEPLLTPAVGTEGNVTQVGVQSINLRLACRTADTMRLSEDSAFNSVFFTAFTNSATFPLSSGGGVKTVFAQYRSVTGQTSAPVAITVTYITTGPTVTGFDLSEGDVLARPLLITGSATAPLGMAAIEFYVDGVGRATNSGNAFSHWFDVRSLSSGVHRAKLVARDNSGNIATRELNFVVSPTPPPAPVIIDPSGNKAIGSNTVNVAGSAEPYIQVQLFRSGTLVGTTNASANGLFYFASVPLNEGANQLIAQAVDSVGSSSSLSRQISVDTMAPAQLIMDTPVYKAGIGLSLTWHFPTTGKRASQFVVYWSTSPISDTTKALGHTVPLVDTSTTLQGLAAGTYYFYVVGSDALGNKSPLSAAVVFAYDATPPSFTIGFDKPSPVTVGRLHVILSASEAINGVPTLTVQPNGSTPSLLPLTNSALNTFEGDINVTALLSSGPVKFRVSGADMAGNTFTGEPNGPALTFDLTPPAGYITTAQTPPIQTTNATNITLSLQLTEAPQSGTTPTLNFGPPIGSAVPVALSGAGTNWSGTLTLTPAMGSGFGHFTLTVLDSLGNVGHSINSGSALELYNTALPSAPGQPVNFHVTAQSAGRMQLAWDRVDGAEVYRVYSETGTTFVVPTFMVADNIVSNNYVDVPATDGSYRYVVAASRRGAEGVPSIVRVAVSDRTPPPAPVNVAVQLASSGLQITWQAGTGEKPDHYNVYRNGSLIRSVDTVAPVIDYPPRGVMTYTVASVDKLGNEAQSDAVTFQMLVGAVENLQAIVSSGQATLLTWTSSDSTAAGYNVYRNGIKQNTSALVTPKFTDSLPAETELVTYSVTAVNATNAESASRKISVYALDLGLLVNSQDGITSGAPIASYFDRYAITLSNKTAAAQFPLSKVEVQRTGVGASPLTLVNSTSTNIAANGACTIGMTLASANASAQSVRLRATQQTDNAGNTVIYEKTFAIGDVQTPGVTLEVQPVQLPLAGGLTPFSVKVYNRGVVPVYLATTRQNGAKPGDVYIAVKNPQGQEVGRTPFNGTPSGVIFYGDAGYVSIPAGGSTSFTVPGVLVPEALASNVVTFQAVVSAIYDNPSASNPQVSGPLSGTTQSKLTQTPYYGTAETDHELYSNNQPIIISGQALDRVTGLPLANKALKIGFATRGYLWYVNVTTGTNGAYTYTYNPTPGFAGTLAIWAAHPDVFDQLQDAQVTVYRIYASPQGGDIQMSKNDNLSFTVSLLNPGDKALTGFNLGFEAYQMNGTNKVPLTTMHGTIVGGNGFNLAAGQRSTVTLNLAADANAPSNAVVVFTLTSAEGASATFTGYVNLLPAVPVLSVVQPENGYVEVSLDRGTLLSRQVTVVNRGLKDLQGVTIVPPANVKWMSLNLPTAQDGTIALPDILVGQTNSFTVVFTPPSSTELGYFSDKLTIKGTNATLAFDVNLYARVTSANKGNVQFYVDNILGLDVPGATVRLRNTALQVELPPVQTDINGLVTVTNLQEGNWSWQVSAPGHSAAVGVVTVIPAQTVNVSTRLSKSVVTVNFSVVPVPYTDRYEIQLEQTFETHVPVPVLVMTPSFRQFDNVTPGFQASYIVTVKNEGLIQMENLTIKGQTTAMSSFTPLITYMPVLLPQQTVEVPFTVTYSGTNAPVQQGVGGALKDCLPDPSSIGSDIPAFVDGLKAIANAEGRCIKDNSMLAIAGGVAIGLKLYQDLTGLVAPVAEQIANYIGCVIGTLLGQGLDGPGAATSGPSSSSTQDFRPTGAGCFAPDTAVLLADGTSKRIDQVVVGDIVRSGNDVNSTATVAETYHLKSGTSRVIKFSNGTDPLSIVSTDEHLFWVDGSGWVAANQLQVGDWLLGINGDRFQITANERIRSERDVFTIKLKGDTAFYANGVLVHDLCGVLAPTTGVVNGAAIKMNELSK